MASPTTPPHRLLDTRSKAEKVADLVEARIRSGATPAGTHLGTKSELATSYSVAYQTLDAALRVLVDRKLVTLRPGARGGVTVAEDDGYLSLGDARWPLRHLDIGDVRVQRQSASVALALEPLIIAGALRSATRTDQRRMRETARRLAAVKDADSYLHAHRALHMALLSAGHNQVLVSLIPALWSVTLQADAAISPPEGRRFDDWAAERAEVHQRIIDAVLAKHLQEALAALHLHAASGHDLAGFTPGYQALHSATAPPSPLAMAAADEEGP